MKEIEVSFFPVWRRYLTQIREIELPDKQLGTLHRAMMEYQFEGKVPEKLPTQLRTIWTFMRNDLDCARKRYESQVRNGRKGGRKKKENPTETQNNLDETQINREVSEKNPEEGISITESISTQGQCKATQEQE